MWRVVFMLSMLVLSGATLFLSITVPNLIWLFVLWGPILILGIYDILQSKKNVLRNYPVVGHFRYLLLAIRPEIQQYFIENEQNGKPFSKEQRDFIAQRATGRCDDLPFGTQHDVYQPGYEFINHSIAPIKVDHKQARHQIGGPSCQHPYLASRLNISAMSFGALSANAICALNRGAALGGFAHNTGEGGLSDHHLQEGGDIIWQIGTGYFGCRTADGGFDLAQFSDKAMLSIVKMIELKISQGAKPAHGGILPGPKVSDEIARIRGLTPGVAAISPPAHKTFDTPISLLEFIAQLREHSGGKPVGFKLCLGRKQEFLSICKAMLLTGITPDFITVDGAEGGTGAAPVEFTDSIGFPLDGGLAFVHSALTGIDKRKDISLIASGKIISGFDMVCKFALGADLCNSARGMMIALGCIQSRRCHSNTCPTGIATQDPHRAFAVDINDKAPRIARYHQATIDSFLEVMGAAAINTVDDLHPGHIHRRINHQEISAFSEIYPFLDPGALLEERVPDSFAQAWQQAKAESF